MRREGSGSGAERELAIAFTAKPVSGWGGLVALVRHWERIGLREVLRGALPDGRTSPNQIAVTEIVLGLFMTVLTGGKRFAHAERVRGDEVIRAIVGVRRLPSAMTLTRYFGGFLRSQVELLSETLWRWQLERVRAVALGAVIDLDSTVLQRYGRQEGSLPGHNPRKHGRPSHHPLVAFLAEAKLILHVWLRSGNTTSGRGARGFLAEALARLPEDFRLYALRADAGFCIEEFLSDLEQRGLPYAVAARMTAPFKRRVVGIKDWQELAAGLAVGELSYQPFGWPKARRFIVVRQEERLRPDAGGRRLFELPGYVFHSIVTTLPLAPAELWRFYNVRSDAENRLKELKDDFGAVGFCMRSFNGTDAVLRLICCLFNLVAEFKREVLRDPAPRLATVRARWLVIGASLGASGRRRILRLGLRGSWRQRFEQLLERLRRLPRSTVTQFDESASRQPLTSLRPWKPRRPYHRPAPVLANLRVAL